MARALNAASWVRAWTVSAAFVRVSYLQMLAYRLRFYTGIVTYLIYVVIYTSIWRAVYEHPSAREALSDFGSFHVLFTYFAIGWLARSFTFNTIDRDLAELVETGHVAARLARPVSLHHQMLAEGLGQVLFRLTCFSPWIGLVLFLFFDLAPPASGTAFLRFVAAQALAVLILAEINFLVGLLAFRTPSILGIVHAKQTAIELLSGLMVPLAYFPEAIGSIVRWTPFPTLVSVPNRLYLGLLPPREADRLLLVSAAWAAALFAAGHLAGKWAQRSQQIQGG